MKKFLQVITAVFSFFVQAADVSVLTQFKSSKDCKPCVAWFPDGKRLAMGMETEIKIVNFDKKEMSIFKSESNNIISVSVSPDSKILALLYDDGILLQWNQDTGKVTEENKERPLPNKDSTDHYKPVSIVFSPIDKYGHYKLAIVYSILTEIVQYGIDHSLNHCHDTYDYIGTYIENGRMGFYTLKKLFISWAPNPNRLARNGLSLVLYDYQLEEPRGYGLDRPDLGYCNAHKEFIWGVAWSSDNRTVATCSEDKTIKIWTTPNTACWCPKLYLNPDETLIGHEGPVYSISFSPSGEFLVSVSGDKTLRIWNIVLGQCINVIETDESLNSVSWSPDGSKLVTISEAGNITIWNVNFTSQVNDMKMCTII